MPGRDCQDVVLHATGTVVESDAGRFRLLKVTGEQVNPDLPVVLTLSDAANFAVSALASVTDERWIAVRQKLLPAPIQDRPFLAVDPRTQDASRASTHATMLAEYGDASRLELGGSLEIPPLESGDCQMIIRFSKGAILINTVSASGAPQRGSALMSARQTLALACAILAHPFMQQEEERLRGIHGRAVPRFCPFLLPVMNALLNGRVQATSLLAKPLQPAAVPASGSWQAQARARLAAVCLSLGLPKPQLSA